MPPPRKSCREVKGITFAAPCLRPSFIPLQKSRKGSKGAGLRYEKLVAKAIPNSVLGQWFHYIDANGAGWCQPDVLVLGRKRVLVLECKLTLTSEAFRQLQLLYFPVLRQAYPEREIIGGVVCKNLTPEVDFSLLFESIPELIAKYPTLDSPSAIPVVHWLGSSPLAGPTKP